jgi:SAM-dependent methyltransferase
MSDSWQAGRAYEDFMGRWSRRLANAYLDWLRAPRGAHWLDVGCGTGAQAHAICEHVQPASVTACDPAAPLIEFARGKANDSHLQFVIAGVGGLPRREAGFDCVASLLALNFFPDPAAAVTEMAAVSAPGATVTACVWDYGGGMQFLRRFWDAATSLDPAAKALDEARRFAICSAEELTRLFRGGGLAEVHCEPIEIATTFANFADYWQPFLGGTGPAPAYVGSLTSEGRAALAQRLESKLPRGSDGSISLVARAWAVRGVVVRR